MYDVEDDEEDVDIRLVEGDRELEDSYGGDDDVDDDNDDLMDEMVMKNLRRAEKSAIARGRLRKTTETPLTEDVARISLSSRDEASKPNDLSQSDNKLNQGAEALNSSKPLSASPGEIKEKSKRSTRSVKNNAELGAKAQRLKKATRDSDAPPRDPTDDDSQERSAEASRPPRPKNPFFVFKEEFDRYKSDGIPQKQLMKFVSKRWSEMTEEEKEPFRKAAQQNYQDYVKVSEVSY